MGDLHYVQHRNWRTRLEMNKFLFLARTVFHTRAKFDRVPNLQYFKRPA